MKYGLPVFVLSGALVVAIGVLGLLGSRSPAEAPEVAGLTAADGRPFRFDALDRRIRLAVLLSPGCAEGCARVVGHLVETRGEPAPEILVFAERDALPGGAGPRGIRGDRAALRTLATDRLGFDTHVEDEGIVLVALIDRSSRVHRRWSVSAAGGPQAWSELDTWLDELAFLRGLAWRPRLHAALNGFSALVLLLGFWMIRQSRYRTHAACMIVAALTTVGFLASYIHYHFHAGSIAFRGEGWSRPVYFGVLLSHTILAAFVAPLATALFYYVARRNFGMHRRVARWTLPLWIYVSVTGVLIYLMLYVWFAP